MKANFKLLITHWAIHFGALWISFNLLEIVPVIFRPPRPHQETALHYFIRHNFQNTDVWVISLFLLLTEINYRLIFKKQPVFAKWFIPLYITTCILTGILSFGFLWLLGPEKFEYVSIPQIVGPIALMAIYALLYALVRDYFFRLRHKKDLSLQLAQNELNALKAQLNPHFLFNSLNYLYGTALSEDAPLTSDGIDKLSSLMRYSITGIHENFVPLESELKFVADYLALQQARIPKNDSIIIAVQIPVSAPELKIAPMLLLPFIENAFKYGISMDETCFVRLTISITGTRLTMQLSNTVISNHNTIAGSNTGIKNTVKRLQLLYQDGHRLEIKDNPTSYDVVLSVNLN